MVWPLFVRAIGTKIGHAWNAAKEIDVIDSLWSVISSLKGVTVPIDFEPV